MVLLLTRGARGGMASASRLGAPGRAREKTGLANALPVTTGVRSGRLEDATAPLANVTVYGPVGDAPVSGLDAPAIRFPPMF